MGAAKAASEGYEFHYNKKAAFFKQETQGMQERRREGESMPTIELKNVSKWYESGWGRKHKKRDLAIDEVDLTIEQGEFVFFIGSAGAGKSTLLNLICGDIKPSRGRVLLDGRYLQTLVGFHGRKSGSLFGHVYRDPMLDRRLSVEGNLLEAAKQGGTLFESEEKARERVMKALGIVGLQPCCGVLYPWELNRGEYRRVEVAKALVNSPPVLVLDELTANLDDDNIWDMFHLLTELNRKGTTIIMATHSSKYVNLMRRRVVTLVDGRIFADVKKGRYGDVLENNRILRMPNK